MPDRESILTALDEFLKLNLLATGLLFTANLSGRLPANAVNAAGLLNFIGYVIYSVATGIMILIRPDLTNLPFGK